jgi:hypothetical protein
MNAKISPWIFVVVGVLTVLFAVFGLQQQTDALAAKEQVELLKVQLQLTVTEASHQRDLAAEMAAHATRREQELAGKLEDCMKSKRK